MLGVGTARGGREREADGLDAIVGTQYAKVSVRLSGLDWTVDGELTKDQIVFVWGGPRTPSREHQIAKEWPCHPLLLTLPMGPSHPPALLPPADLGSPSGYPTDPYLAYRPVFARSLPIQILFTGIALTLVSVLLVQLLFSAPTHLRLARTNFFLQISAALAVLAWEIACLTIVLNITREQSQVWPFMLDYVAIDFPPLNDPRTHGTWSTAGLASWFFMNAMVSVLTQVCHIL